MSRLEKEVGRRPDSIVNHSFNLHVDFWANVEAILSAGWHDMEIRGHDTTSILLSAANMAETFSNTVDRSNFSPVPRHNHHDESTWLASTSCCRLYSEFTFAYKTERTTSVHD